METERSARIVVRNHRVYVGTWEGLYEAAPAGDAYGTRLLGLESPPSPVVAWNDYRGAHPAGRGPVRWILADRDAPTRLYAATNRAGVFRSEDGGRTWREMNRGLVYKETWSLAQHPATGDLYVGTGPSALFRSTDRGETWLECQALRCLPGTRRWTFPRPPYVSHVRHIGLDAADPELIYCAIEEGGIVRSRDGGTSWELIDEGHGIHPDVHTVNVIPGAPSLLVATTGHGVYRSLDGGDVWTSADRGLGPRLYMAHLAVHPSRPEALFTAAAAGIPPDWARDADAAFFRSDDRGISWRRWGGSPESLTAAPRAVAGDPMDPDTVVVGMTDGTVWLTEDGGGSFRRIVRGLPHVTSLLVIHG